MQTANTISVFISGANKSQMVHLLLQLLLLVNQWKFSTIFLCHFVAQPFADLHAKFYGDRPRG